MIDTGANIDMVASGGVLVVVALDDGYEMLLRCS